ncbi:uncharacterized protein LOC120701601 isoform X1 [Panicum virgatum]|uniref:uncharacterized protein LOC120701601 isoform X1 n=1 Tax=Panicum virgatum TaxID=38727 RepID=UPI0019D5D839|nr:uncharacterized protein LOC120701601 isoform X1 [Panicum virgatum]
MSNYDLEYCRIDPKSACRVEVTVNSYFTIQDGRKEYNRDMSTREEDMRTAVSIGEDEMPTAVSIGEDEMPTAVNIGEEVIPAAMDTDLEVPGGGFTWAEVPEYGESTAGPPMDEEEEKEHFINVGCDPNGDELAGADEEWRYFKNVDNPVIDLDASMLSVNIAVLVWSFVQLYVCIWHCYATLL